MQPQTKTHPKFLSSVSVYKTPPDQAIPAGAWTTLQLDAENFDLLGEYDIATFGFTPIRTGYYYYSGFIYWNTGIGQSTREMRLRNNLGVNLCYSSNICLAGQIFTLAVSGIAHINAGETILAQVRHSDAGAVNIVSNTPSGTKVMYHRIS